jgi:hypothetical protein
MLNKKESNMKHLITQLEKAFEKCDAYYLEQIPSQVEEMVNTWSDIKKKYYETHDRSEWKYLTCPYGAVFQKKAYYYNLQDHIKLDIKETKRKHENRNAKIAGKLEKAGITNIDAINFEVEYGNDFVGSWIIDGHKVTIKVIFAGGYNIQCLHNRVLCNVKKAA